MRQVLNCLRPLPPYTLYTCILYTYSHRKGWGVRANKEKVRRATVHKDGSKILVPTWQTVSSVFNSDKHLPQSPITGKFLRWRHFSLVSLYSISPCTVVSNNKITFNNDRNIVRRFYRSKIKDKSHSSKGCRPDFSNFCLNLKIDIIYNAFILQDVLHFLPFW